MIEKTLVSLEEAIAIVLDNCPSLACERVPIGAALHRGLAENVTARREHPPWNNSAMDGYAVRSEDVADASTSQPVVLNVVGEIQAGATATQVVNRGEAIQIMTGAPTPAGADTVVCVEDCDRIGDRVQVKYAAKRGDHIRLKGEDITTGQQLLTAGTTLRPAALGVLATAGYSSVLVRRQASVSVLATGDELVEPGEALGPEQIINSNSYSVSALVRDSGARCLTLPSARDNPDDLKTKIAQALQADVALVIGGVSMGKYDYVKEVLEGLGCRFKFWRVAVRPGHPVAFGIVGSGRDTRLLFGLPGNPVSCVVGFYQFVRPLLRKMMGHETLFLPEVEATLVADFRKKAGRTHLARATTTFRDGRYHVQLAPQQGSGVLTSFIGANSLAVLPAPQTTFSAGEVIKVQLLPE